MKPLTCWVLTTLAQWLASCMLGAVLGVAVANLGAGDQAGRGVASGACVCLFAVMQIASLPSRD